MANSVDPDQTAPIGAVCSGSTLFASILNFSILLGNYFQQMTSADDIFRRVKDQSDLQRFYINHKHYVSICSTFRIKGIHLKSLK